MSDRRPGPIGPFALAFLTALATAAALAGPASAAQLSGRVTAAGAPVAGAKVTLYASGAVTAGRLGSARTDSRGAFRLSFRRPRAGAVLHAVSSGGRGPSQRALRLMAVADPRARAPRRLALNELTTVAAAYSLSRFLRGPRLAGPATGLRNAAATVASLVRPATGTVAPALAQPPNGSETASLATFRTLGSILGGCAGGTTADCQALLRATTPPRGPQPRDTLAAIHAVALNPVHNVKRIFALRRSVPRRGLLKRPPTSWVLSLKHTDGGYDGPGRMAFDSRGNIWVTNNFEPPGTEPGLGVISLDPTGGPRNGSPVTGGGVKGVWWGIAVDLRDRVWLSNFIGDDPHDWNSPEFVGGTSAALFTSGGRPLSGTGITAGELSAPQGIAVDQAGNVWIANHGSDTVTMYPKGDPRRARVIRGGGLYNPFTVAIDADGNAWVDNGSLDPNRAGSLTRIAPDGRVTGPFEAPRMRSPQGMAIDSAGNLWVASLADSNVTWLGPDGRVKGQFRAPSIQGGWGVAIDGEDNVWVASFVGRKVTLLCGRLVRNCPPGSKTGDPISPRRRGFTNGGLQHVTAVQVDQSGNVWVANNWEKIKPTVGGDGLVEFIGAAAPVRTPLIGPPRPPR